jgi:hypothetical protein
VGGDSARGNVFFIGAIFHGLKDLICKIIELLGGRGVELLGDRGGGRGWGDERGRKGCRGNVFGRDEEVVGGGRGRPVRENGCDSALVIVGRRGTEISPGRSSPGDVDRDEDIGLGGVRDGYWERGGGGVRGIVFQDGGRRHIVWKGMGFPIVCTSFYNALAVPWRYLDRFQVPMSFPYPSILSI